MMSNSKPANQRARPAAQQHQVTAKDRRRLRFQHHKEVARDCFRQLFIAPLSTFMTVLVLAIALALPGFLFASLANVARLADSWEGENKISLYLQTNLSSSQIDSFVQRLLIREDLIAIDLIDSEQGMLEFQQLSGLGDVLSALEQNPLPAVVSVLARDTSEESLAALQQELAALAQVEQAQLDLQWIKRFNAGLLVVKRGVIALSFLLAFAVLLVIGNTVRLNVASRHDEILVSKLMGATNAWVRRPFLYTGICYGLAGGVFAWLILEFSLLVMRTPVASLAQLYQSDFVLAGLGIIGGAVLLVVAVFLGWLGALLSVNKFLSHLDPQ